MKCKNCKGLAVKNGKQANGKQRYYCKQCKISFQRSYKYNGHNKNIDKHIGRLRGLLLKKFNAKYFHELPKAVQQRYLDNRPKQ